MKRNSLFARAVQILVLLCLAGCAFDKSETDPNRKRDLNNRQKLLTAYQAIQGVYEGTYVTLARTELVRLTLSYTEVVVGKTQDGEVRYQPELRARFSRLERNVFDTYLTASLVPETSDLTLTTTTDTDALYVRGIISGGTFNAPVKNREGGELGQLSLKLVNREVVVPPEGQDNEVYDRIKAILAPIQGEYIGVVRRTTDGKPDHFNLTMLIRLEDRVVNGIIVPVLACYSRREDGVSTSAKHSIIYNGNRNPVELTFEPAPMAVGYGAWSLKSTYEFGVIKGEIVYQTFVADFEARRKPAKDEGKPK